MRTILLVHPLGDLLQLLHPIMVERALNQVVVMRLGHLLPSEDITAMVAMGVKHLQIL
jgi:hypothetical protein